MRLACSHKVIPFQATFITLNLSFFPLLVTFYMKNYSGDQMVDHNHQQIMVRSFQQNVYLTDGSIEGYMPSELQVDGSNWQISQTYLNTPIENAIRLNILESNSNDDLTSPRSFITGGEFCINT